MLVKVCAKSLDFCVSYCIVSCFSGEIHKACTLKINLTLVDTGLQKLHVTSLPASVLIFKK